MSRIPLHVKVSLLNNYLQTNYLKTRGKAEHDDFPISKILENIIEDLNTLDKERSKTQEELPIGLILRDLKFIQDKHKSLKESLGSISEELNNIKDQQSDPSLDLDDIIKKLEAFNKL